MSFKRKALDALADDAKRPRVDASIASFFGAPKSSGIATTASGDGETILKKFDKDKWVAGLPDEQRQLLQLEIDTMDESWLGELKDEITTASFLNLKRFLNKEWAGKTPIYPPRQDIYSWSKHTPLTKVKAVILGQDPYHGPNQAHGLCFSVKPPTAAPPSLKNMYTALQKDYPGFKPPPNNGGDLTKWAEQGVLMINTCLTVRQKDANSHSKQGWEQFTQKVIETVAKTCRTGVVFLCWGRPAQDRVKNIDKKKHHILTSVHPSPLSAARGFFDCGHFKKTNEWLRTRYGVEGEIDWNLQKPLTAVNTNKPPVPAPVKPVVAKPLVVKAIKDADDEFDDDFDETALEVMNEMSDRLAPSSPARPSELEKIEEETKEAEKTVEKVAKTVDELKATVEAVASDVKELQEDLQDAVNKAGKDE